MRIAILSLALIVLVAGFVSAAVQYDGDLRVVRVRVVTDEEFQQFHLDGANYAKGVIGSVSEIFEKIGKVRLVVMDAGYWKSPNDARDILEMMAALQDQVSLGDVDMVIGFISQPPGALEIASRQVEGGIGSIFEPYVLVREPQGVRECLVESTAHEIGHALGLDHVNDQSSFMRPATSPNPVFTLDKENTEILQITRSVDFAKGLDSLPDSALDKLKPLYEKLSSAMPEDDGPRYALSLIAKRKLGEALVKARAAVEKSPNDLTAKRSLANLSLEAGGYAESEKQYREILKKQPDDADAHNGLGLALLRQGKLQEAARELGVAVRLKPDDSQMHSNLAGSLMQMGRVEEAVREYREALRIKPDLFEAHANLASILGRQGKFDEAAKEYRQAISINTNDARTHSDFGVVLLQMNQSDEAIKEFQQAVKLDPGLSEAHTNLALLLKSQGKNEQAILEYQWAIRSNPGNLGARLDLGSLLVSMDKLDEAAQEFRSALEMGPDSPDAPDLHNNLGVVYARQGKVEEAMHEFREAIRLRPAFPSAHTSLGSLLGQRGQLDEAIKEFEEAIRIKPDSSSAHGALAMAYFEKKQYASAWKQAHLCQKYAGKLDPEFRKALTEQMPEPTEQ